MRATMSEQNQALDNRFKGNLACRTCMERIGWVHEQCNPLQARAPVWLLHWSGHLPRRSRLVLRSLRTPVSPLTDRSHAKKFEFTHRRIPSALLTQRALCVGL